MQKKLKPISKIVCAILLSVILFSFKCFANEITPFGMSGYRCLNSSCAGAYLWDYPSGSIPCTTCGSGTSAYECITCRTQYNICDNGHYQIVR